MKRFLITSIFACVTTNGFALEILALGTSNTNCKGANQTYTKTLNELLHQDGIKATVINGGKDGDTPQFMLRRMPSLINPTTRIVIFEPGPNEKNKSKNLADAEKILSQLQEMKMPTIYVSNRSIEEEAGAEARAFQFDATYYGNWARGVPVDKEHRQYDQPHIPNSAGHMTEAGCRRWANNIYPLIKKVIADHALAK